MNNSLFASKSRQITYFAVLAALTTVLQLFANSIPIGAASINLTLVPIVITGMILGVWYATAIGFVSGIITMIQVVSGAGGLFSILFSYSPVILILVCVLKTTIAAFVGAWIFKIIKNKTVATFISAGAVPIINTLIFILGMLIVSGYMSDAINEFNAAAGETVLSMESGVIAFILVVLVGLNFPIEIGVNILLAPAIYNVVKIVDKSFSDTENTDKTVNTSENETKDYENNEGER